MTSLQTLPAVASNFYYLCKKCEVDRYHKVLTHPTPLSAQLQCEVCKKKSTFKPKAAAKEKELSASGKPVKGARAQANMATKKASAYAQEFDGLKKHLDEGGAIVYKMTVTFKTHQTVSHPKFGIGLVRTVMGDKIEVYFADESRLLVHGRA